MVTGTSKTHCATCAKEKTILKCEGCTQDFCHNHWIDHHQELGKQLEEVESARDNFRETLKEPTTEPQKHALMEQIDNQEHDSIKKIQKTAEEARQILLKQTEKLIIEIEDQLNKLTDQLRQSREENNFCEIDLQQWNKELSQLSNQLTKPSNIVIRKNLHHL